MRDIISNFVKNIVAEEVEIIEGTDFMYQDCGDYKMIQYARYDDNIDEELYREFLSYLGYCGKDNMFIIALLHEIGHCVNDAFISVEDENFSEGMKDWINSQMIMTPELYFMYCGLPDELAANKYAVFALKHFRKEIDELWMKICSEIVR